MDTFWIRLKRKYLISLRRQHRGNVVNKQNIYYTDAVLIHHENSRITWNVGFIDNLSQLRDEFRRFVQFILRLGFTGVLS